MPSEHPRIDLQARGPQKTTGVITKPELRAFVFPYKLFKGIVGYNGISALLSLTVGTRSIFTTITSTTTIPTIQSCIPLAQFAAGLTNGCRKRSAPVYEIEMKELSPTQVIP